MQAEIKLDAIQSNIVCFRVRPPVSTQGVLAHLAANKVQALGFRGGVRMVTHFDVSAEDVQTALTALRSAEDQPNGPNKPVEVQAAPSADGAVANGHADRPVFKEY